MMMRGFTQRAAVVRARDEVAEHRLGDLEVGDDAVAQRADRDDVARRAAEHLLGFVADREHLLAAAPIALDRDDRRLAAHDAPPLDVDEGGGGAEIDREIVRGVNQSNSMGRALLRALCRAVGEAE